MPTVQTVAVVITCAIAIGGILIFIGRSLHSLQQIDINQKVLFDKTDNHSKDIARMDKELTQVKTRQEDCGQCP